MSALLPLRLSEVTVAVGDRAILDRVSAQIEAGPRTIILGANGAGKSVLMRVCHGLLAPTSGKVEWHAAEVSGAPRRQAMVFQRPGMLRRSALAKAQAVPAYVVLPDRSLIDMARRRPASLAEMAEVHGIGEAKLKRYHDAYRAHGEYPPYSDRFPVQRQSYGRLLGSGSGLDIRV